MSLQKVVGMLRRKVLAQIEEWYQDGCRKALLLTEARQVGKTTVVREFAKQHYAHFVEINFVKRPVAQQAFDGNLDTKTIITNLSAMGFGPFVEGKTLVFFDEIQECPNARTASSSLWKTIPTTILSPAHCWESITSQYGPTLLAMKKRLPCSLLTLRNSFGQMVYRSRF